MNPLFGTDDFDWSVLAAYFAAELPPEDLARYEAWLDADPSRRGQVERLRSLWEVAGRPLQRWDAEAALQTFKGKADRAAGSALVEVRRSDRLRVEVAPRHFALPHTGPSLIAAGLALVLFGAATGAWLLRDRETPPAETPEPMAVLSTQRGQRARLALPDGSRVLLGPASTLQYAAKAFGRSRELFLDGDALFEVAHDPEHPLRVYSSRGMTEDVGTTFAVSDHGESIFRVVVAEGSVMLHVPTAAEQPDAPMRDSLLLEPADLGQVGNDGRLVRRRNVDVESYLAWREGRLVFRETSLREVLYRLSIWYDLEIELGDSTLAARPFTATFEHETTDQVLRTLAVALGLRYEHRGSLLLVLPDRTPGKNR